MSFFNMFGGAPKNTTDSEEIKNPALQEDEVPQRTETAVVEDGVVLTPGDQEVIKEERQIPENWREQA